MALMYDGQVFAAVSTVPGERNGEYRKTMDQLRAAGVEPTTFVVDHIPQGKRNSLNNRLQVCRAFLASPARSLLFLEDDIEIGRDFKRVLDEVVAMDAWEVFAFYVNEYAFYPPALRENIRAGRPFREGFQDLVNASKWYGSLAMLLSRRVIEPAVPYLEEQLARLIAQRDRTTGVGGLDTGIGVICARLGLGISTYLPNTVQHRGANIPSTWMNHPSGKISRTFKG